MAPVGFTVSRRGGVTAAYRVGFYCGSCLFYLGSLC